MFGDILYNQRRVWIFLFRWHAAPILRMHPSCDCAIEMTSSVGSHFRLNSFFGAAVLGENFAALKKGNQNPKCIRIH